MRFAKKVYIIFLFLSTFANCKERQRRFKRLQRPAD